MTTTTVEFCTQCGYSHAAKNRQRNIKRMVDQGVDVRTIKTAWPCFYPHVRVNDNSDARLFRDIRAIKERGENAIRTRSQKDGNAPRPGMIRATTIYSAGGPT